MCYDHCQLFLPRTKIKDARSFRPYRQQVVYTCTCRVTSSLEAKRNKEKLPTEQGLGAQCSGENGRDSNVSHGKYVYET